MLRTQAEGKRKSSRTIKLEKVDKDSLFITKMKKHLKNYKFYGSGADEPEIMELTDQDEALVDPSEDAPITNVKSPEDSTTTNPTSEISSPRRQGKDFWKTGRLTLGRSSRPKNPRPSRSMTLGERTRKRRKSK